MKRRAIAGILLVSSAVACNALFGDTAQCKNDGDCAGFGANMTCSADGLCVARSGGPTPSGGDGGGPAAPGQDGGSSSGGAVATITIAPSTAAVAPGLTQQFSAIAKDKDGNTPSGGDPITWSTTGGTIGSTGVFTAPMTGAGPFTITARSGNVTGTATVTIASMSIQMGETNILNGDDSGNANLLLAQEATLAQTATIKSLSFYIATAAGNLRLGVYDATGPNGGPGAKKAETAEVAAATGWNAIPVVTPVQLAAGKYWLAYAPNDNNLHFRLAGDGTGKLVYFEQTYGPLPATFSTNPAAQNDHWSFYATLTVP